MPSVGRCVDEIREFNIPLTDATGIMGGKRNIYPVVDVKPFRVVVYFFGHQCYARHEAKCFVEILEKKGFLNGVAVCDLSPAIEIPEEIRARAQLPIERMLEWS